MQVICGLLIFQRTPFERSLDLISPWLEMQTREISDVIADLDAQRQRRFIRSHTPLDGLRYDDTVTYICVRASWRATEGSSNKAATDNGRSYSTTPIAFATPSASSSSHRPISSNGPTANLERSIARAGTARAALPL